MVSDGALTGLDLAGAEQELMERAGKTVAADPEWSAHHQHRRNAVRAYYADAKHLSDSGG